ncbi:hypothetical protein MAR_004631, partial [Mya arenaria]
MLKQIPIFLSCHVFDPKNWPSDEERQALILYGDGDLQALYDHFETPLINAGCDLNSAKSEWKDLKLGFKPGGYRKGRVQNILLIIHFSVMKSIKDDWRCSLSTEQMDQLMKININDNGNFNPQQAVNR